MSRPPVKRNPAARRGFEGAVQGLRALYSGKAETTRTSATRKGWASPNLPRNWRDRLPHPGAYYAQHVGKLTRANGSGYAQGKCPFHEDGNASLSVNLMGKGGWKCFAGCGSGDLVSFHERLRGCDFKTAVLELVRGGV
jgi:hypothetical protein